MQKIKLQTKRAALGLLLCLPTAAGVIALYLLPLFMAAWHSLHSTAGAFTGLQGYLDLFGNAAFLLAAKNTLLFWCVALPLNLLLGMAAALICRPLLARAALFFPALLPAACVAVIVQCLLPVYSLSPAAGLCLQLAVYLWKSVGCTALILSAALYTIPHELEDEATCCGAGSAQIFFRIKLPLLLPAVGASLLVAFLYSFKIFRESYLLWGTHPENALYSLHHFLYNNFANMNYPRLAAASMLLIAAIFLLCAVALRILKRKGVLDGFLL